MTAAPLARAFEKWQGLGNDFVLLADPPRSPAPEVVRRLCDRRFGIGADGVLVVEGLATSSPRMIVYNADGSRPEMCGNGLRCVAGYLAKAAGRAGEITIATDAGAKRCAIEARGDDEVVVTVGMGVAKMEPDLVVSSEGTEHRFAMVDVGNPHAITFEPYDNAAIDRLGPFVERVPRGGTNVEFCRVDREADARRIEVIVWERGVGRTLACGTGACAVAASACERGLAPWGAPVRVALPGGELEITVEANTRSITMRGPARRVFSGEVVIA
jgi:diaminopimelate epimerase